MQNYIAALLSNITYLKIEDYALRPDGTLMIFDQAGSGISAAETSLFNEYFTIEYQKNGTEGFSAMKIVAIKTSDFLGIQSGDVTIAFRGTEAESNDWITDIGMGIKAISALTPKIITEGSKYLPGLLGMIRALGDLPVWEEHFKSQSQQALDYFNVQKKLSNNITVVGHSLGGYLANYVTTTGDNYTYINETRTFNAPGFNASRMAMLEVQKEVEKILSTTTNLTEDQINELIHEVNNLSIKIGGTSFNPDSFSKLNPFFAENGPELTSNDIVMFLPESVNKIPMFITPQIVPTNTHGIGLLTESSALYDILNTIMTGSLIDNYKKITKLLESFESHPLTTKTINTISSYISHFFGFSTQNPSAIIQYLDVLTPESLNSYIYNDINHSTYDKSSSSLYALFNFIPFSISNIEDFFKNTTFDIDNYTQKNIDERYNLFEKYQALKTPTVSNATLKDLNIYESYKVIYEENSSSAYIIFDEYNKIILTNDSRSASSSAGIGDFSFYGDSFANIETTYLKNNQSALFVNTLKNKVFDTYSDDYIHLNKGKTTLDLSYGSDTVSIDVAAGATIKDLTIKDDGLGDLFIFNGGSNSDIITGTKYKDKIIGNDGDDHLFSGAGNDTINGGNGNDFIFGEDGDDNLIGDDGDDRIMGGAGSNYLEGGNGDDTLNAYNTLNEYHDIRGDRLSGGSGTNTLFGTGYGDTYIYGGGIDTIRESDKNFGINYVDKLLFSSNIQSSQVGLYNILNNLVIFINGLEKIFIIDYYNNNYSYLDEIHFINPITGYPIIWDTNYILQHTINTSDNKVIIGSNNDETISGTEADNYIEGRDGNDIINGGDGNDTIYGGNGNDTIHGNNGDDILYGDAGADNIYGDAGNDVIYGGEGNDFLIGGAGNDLIFGEDGDDNISGDDGNDTIHGGIGNDTLNGGNGNDTIYGGGGVDTIQGGAGADTIYGDDGNDIINGGNVRDEVDTIYGGNGNDIINQGSTYTNDIIIGGKGDDTIYGNVGSDKYHYTIGDGNDTIIEANDGASYIDSLYLHGISPNDVEIIRKGANVTDIYITFKDSSEFITIKGYYKSSSGTNYLDEIIFDNGTVWKKANIIEEAKRYYGTEGNDSIAVQSNGLPQAIYAGGGNDSINNSVQGTFINSGEGGDTITSSNNDVIIDADAGDDTIRVVSGTNITINGGAGSDNIQLTTGKETIIYKVNDGSDTITTTGAGGDIFNISGYNKIDLSNIFLSGQGKTLELRFNAGDSIKLTNYINLLANINNAMTFNFDNGSMSNIELKDLYTIINKAEIADNKFYDTVASDQITGTDGDDNINIINGNGGAGFDVVNSGNGIDTITNKIDNTVINAGNDNDIIYTYGQNVTINGDAGDDRIYINETSYVGSGYLNGGEGNDTISFQTYTPVSNNYIIEGDLGNDTINMSRGTETIIFKKNDGNDTINISGSNEPSQKDKLIIKGYSKNDITADNFLLFDNGRSVTLKLGLNDSIKLVNFLSGTLASNNLKYFEFDDGTLTSQELIEKITYIKGTNGNDIIYDTVFKDTIDLSGLGDDRVTLKNGNDLLITGNQSTFIEIQSSNNTINSGSGSDYLYINVNSTNTLNLKSSNNGHDSIGFAYLNTNGIIHVNINKTINIADTSVKGNYYKFSWGHDSSLSFTPDALNNRIIFNNQIMNLDDVNLVGDDGDNYLKAISSKGQTIYGNGGVDTIYGSINNDFIYGGLGNDKIYGQDGDDHLYGDDGDDYIGDTAGNNTIYGGNGNDTIYIGKGNDVVYGGNGNDYIESVSGLNGVDFIYGGDGDDTIKGGAYYGEFHGQDGNDTYEIYKGLIVDQSGSNALIFRESNYTASAIRQTSNGFQLFKGDEILVDYIGIVNKIQINSPSPDGYGRYASLVGTEINKLFELQAALTHEIENDNSDQKINELRSQMSYLWRTDTQ